MGFSADRPALAQRIRADLARSEWWPFRPRPELIWMYRQASELLKDSQIVSAFEAKVSREAPQSLLLFWLAEQRWSKENPQPSREATAEQSTERGWRHEHPLWMHASAALFCRRRPDGTGGSVWRAAVQGDARPVPIVERIDTPQDYYGYAAWDG